MAIDFVTQLREDIATKMSVELANNRNLQPHMFRDSAILVDEINKAEDFLNACREFINDGKMFEAHPPKLEL